MSHRERKPGHKRRVVLILLLVIILAVGTGVSIYFLVKKDDQQMRIKSIAGQSSGGISSFSKSYMNIYKNGTFDVEIVFTAGKTSETIFTGIGTYTKDKTSYTFEYIDCYTTIAGGGSLAQDITFLDISYLYTDRPYDGLINGAFTYSIKSKNRVEFKFAGVIYYFGKK